MISEEMNNFDELSSDGKGMVIIDLLTAHIILFLACQCGVFHIVFFDRFGKPLRVMFVYRV